MINYLIQHDFLGALFRVIHFLCPAERVGGFEFFGDAALLYQPGEGEIDLPLCFLFGFVEMLIERTRGVVWMVLIRTTFLFEVRVAETRSRSKGSF